MGHNVVVEYIFWIADAFGDERRVNVGYINEQRCYASPTPPVIARGPRAITHNSRMKEQPLKVSNTMTRCSPGVLSLAALLLLAPLGCANVDQRDEALAESAQALDAPLLVLDLETIDFGSVSVDSTGHQSVTIKNEGMLGATNITVAYPPDPYFVSHNPPGDLLVGTKSSAMVVGFAPSSVDIFERVILVNYEDGASNVYHLTIPLSGSGH